MVRGESEETDYLKYRGNGEIHDPTKDQFPSKGTGEYEEFNGIVECAQCGKEMAEEDAQFAGNYAVCSARCYGALVGVYC